MLISRISFFCFGSSGRKHFVLLKSRFRFILFYIMLYAYFPSLYFYFFLFSPLPSNYPPNNYSFLILVSSPRKFLSYFKQLLLNHTQFQHLYSCEIITFQDDKIIGKKKQFFTLWKVSFVFYINPITQ